MPGLGVGGCGGAREVCKAKGRRLPVSLTCTTSTRVHTSTRMHTHKHARTAHNVHMTEDAQTHLKHMQNNIYKTDDTQTNAKIMIDYDLGKAWLATHTHTHTNTHTHWPTKLCSQTPASCSDFPTLWILSRSQIFVKTADLYWGWPFRLVDSFNMFWQTPTQILCFFNYLHKNAHFQIFGNIWSSRLQIFAKALPNWGGFGQVESGSVLNSQTALHLQISDCWSLQL